MPKRPVHLPLYAVVILVVMSTLGPILSITAAVKIAKRNQAAALAAAAQSQADQTEATRRESCVLIGRLIDVYEETPPTTAAGRSVKQAYIDYYNGRLMCLPRR